MNHFVHLTEKKQTQTRVNVSVCLMCRDPLERGNNRKKTLMQSRVREQCNGNTKKKHTHTQITFEIKLKYNVKIKSIQTRNPKFI